MQRPPWVRLAHQLRLLFLGVRHHVVRHLLGGQQGFTHGVVDIKAALAAQIRREEEEPQPQAAPEKPAPRLVAVGPDDDVPPMPDDLLLPGMDDGELDADATRRFSDMQFGRDYKIE